MKVRAVLVLLLGMIALAIASCSSDKSDGKEAGCDNPAHTVCGDFCVDLKTDPKSCGSCTKVCSATEECKNGTCTAKPTTECPIGQAKCGGTTCIDIQTNSMNCGLCGNACGSAQACVGGLCTCPGGQMACLKTCANVQTDLANCGSCGRACRTGENCVAGACTCQDGLTQCSGACVDLQSNGANCGSCGMACSGELVCDNGACAAGCSGGRMKCDQSCADFQTDPANCGGCGNKCPAGGACNAGQCSCATAGQALCGGVCVDTQSSGENCGSCGNRCPTGAVCNGGTCACPAGQMQCGTQCVDLKTSQQHCGACNSVCGTTCSNGTCMGGAGGAGGGGGAGGSGGGGGAGGSGGSGGAPQTGCAGPEVINDFETGTSAMNPSEGRMGWWYVFHDDMTGTISPPKIMEAIAAAELPAAEQTECNKYALHVTASGHPQYVGFGGTFLPAPPPSELKSPYSVEKYTGISFKIKAGSGTAPPVFFEMATKENQPPTSGGTAMNDAVDTYNTRGKLITGITSSWQTITVPFSTLAPRYLPDGTGDACGAGVVCEAPRFNPANVLGFQFAVYEQFMTLGANGAFDLWIDDVKFVTGDEGIPTLAQSEAGALKFPRDGMVGTCTKPAGATGKQLIEMFQRWKQVFVVADGGNLRVQRIEESNDTVSEGIAYGLLIAVYFNDKDLFDKLYAYWNAHLAQGKLMTWRIGGQGGSGAATDADEDTAFALLQADKQWPGGNYKMQAQQVINDIWQYEVAGTVLKPGNNFGNQDLFNPSYFSPAWYREFKKVDTAHDWDGVIATGYSYINQIAGANGLVPAWCSNACSSAGGGGYEDANMYQYDSHRMPWRLGLDACWNNNADAKAYVLKTTNFFAGLANNGIGTIFDVYSTTGQPKSGAAANSASIVGTAAIGAMVTAGSNAGHKAFLDRGYQFVLDAAYVPDPTTRADAYTYYNATVGLLMALTMSGNFQIL